VILAAMSLQGATGSPCERSDQGPVEGTLLLGAEAGTGPGGAVALIGTG
jgi:hypothetical protein